jgi:hypothetical protein
MRAVPVSLLVRFFNDRMTTPGATQPDIPKILGGCEAGSATVRGMLSDETPSVSAPVGPGLVLPPLAFGSIGS